LVLIGIIFSLTVSTPGCNLLKLIALGESMQILHKSMELTLAWDPPLTDIPNRPTEVAAYQIYFREHGASYWRFLGEVTASRHPEYSVDYDLVGDGEYDFAVRAISVEGRASPLHTSLDSNADPASGWHVLWVGSQ
jgi:hypothetical protein